MAKANVKFTKDNEYYTPKSVVEYFGKFDYDPATCEEKAKEFGIENYDTIETNGLTKDWTIYKNIWINPPFTEKHKFLEIIKKYSNENDLVLDCFAGSGVTLEACKILNRKFIGIEKNKNYYFKAKDRINGIRPNGQYTIFAYENGENK